MQALGIGRPSAALPVVRKKEEQEEEGEVKEQEGRRGCQKGNKVEWILCGEWQTLVGKRAIAFVEQGATSGPGSLARAQPHTNTTHRLIPHTALPSTRGPQRL